MTPDKQHARRNVRAVWESARATAREQAAQRRERVLAHADLADRLTAPPLCYPRPEQWTGYVPPATWQETRNDAARRAALVDICAEALRREQEGESEIGGDAWASD